MDTKGVKIGRCFTACTGLQTTSILEISLMEGASHTIHTKIRKTRSKTLARYSNGYFSSLSNYPIYNGLEYLEKP